MKQWIASFFAVLFFAGPVWAAAEDLVFVINTSEFDKGGGAIPGAPYINEHDDIKTWEKLYPEAKVVRIRADSNSEITKYLELWMRPNSKQKKVAGLFIRSHGGPMVLANESDRFLVNLPQDIPKVFAPIIGRFSENAKIVFGGCSVLEGKNSSEAAEALLSIAENFKVKSGTIYANKNVGFRATNTFTKVNPWNKDIDLEFRALSVITYSLGFISIPALWLLENKVFNRGYVLTVSGEQWQVEEAEAKKILATPQ